jgi:Spy/CpxP family protein refolding chaperone
MKLPIALVFSVVLAVAASAAPAQSPSSGVGPGRSGFGERRMQGLLKGITLTTVQQAKIDSARAPSCRHSHQAHRPIRRPAQRCGRCSGVRTTRFAAC